MIASALFLSANTASVTEVFMSTMLLSFLSFWDNAVSEDSQDLVAKIITIAIAVILVALVVLLIVMNRKGQFFTTANIASAGICLAASFTLSFIKFSFPNGGSITAASMVPVMLYAYFFGPASGLAVGVVYGLLQFIQAPYLLTPASFLLDYPFAFCSIFWMGFAGKWTKMGEWQRITIGCILVYVTRFVMHLLSGFIYFNHGIVVSQLPHANAFVYSLVYQMTYIPLDMVIAVAALIALSKTKALESIAKIVRK